MAQREPEPQPETPRPREIREAPAPEARPNRKRTRNILIAVVVVAVIGLVLLLRQHSAAAAKQAQAAAANGRNRTVPVSVVPVAARDVPVYLDGLGNVTALNTVTVKTRIDGQLLRFNFQEGQVVRAGEELAVIDPGPSEAALVQAEAAELERKSGVQGKSGDLLGL